MPRRGFTKRQGNEPKSLELIFDEISAHAIRDVVTDCLLWPGRKDKTGYGRVCMTLSTGKYKTEAAHRLAYRKHNGAFSPDLDVHHICHTRLCINPAHLQAVRRKEHLVLFTPESVTYKNARKTQCPQGHPYSDKNTRISFGARKCATCDYERQKRWRHRLREAGIPFWQKGFRVADWKHSA